MSGPDRATMVTALELANRAPSVHNTQPWRWALGTRAVHLMAAPDRRLRVADADGRDLLLSCGAALHHLRVALVALGWRTEVHRMPDPAEPDHLAAVEAFPRDPSTEDIALAAAIPDRRTDRRRFSSWPVPAGHLELIARRAGEAGALLVPATSWHSRLLLTRAIADAARRQRDQPGYAAELAWWSGRSRVADDGVPAANAQPGSPRHGDTTMRSFPGGALAAVETGRGERDGGQLLVLATLLDDPVSVLRAGEAASAALLTATDLGLATCPLSQPFEVADTREFVRTEVLDGAAHPQLVVRTGWLPTAAPPLPPTPRRPVAQTVDELTHDRP